MPQDGPQITDNNDGSIDVRYHPTDHGHHEILIAQDAQPVKDTPFYCIVDKVDNGYVTAHGPGLNFGMSGNRTAFSVVTPHGTGESLDINIDGPSKVDMKRVDNRDGSATISYLPLTPGAYNVHIKYKGRPIKGSPFSAKVSGEGRKRSQISLGNSAEYSLHVIESDIVNLVGNIKTPSGSVEPCILRTLKNGELGMASFTPRDKGRYDITVTRNEKNIRGSPFAINIGDNEIGHAMKVKCTGNALTEGYANKANPIKIDTSSSGYGGLSMVIEGPHRSEVACTGVMDRTYDITYSPHEPGIYILNIRFADEHVQGSPFLVDVGGMESGRVRETSSVKMDAAEIVEPSVECNFILKIPGTNPFDMEASLSDPLGSTELVDVMDEEDNHYVIRFTPTIKGLHIVSVKHKSLHIAGSPFQFTVGSQSGGGPHKVQVGGPGLERGEVGIRNDFNVYTREAGAGEISIAIEGPSKAKIRFEERKKGFLGVSYEVEKAGSYGIHIKFNDEHIPNSPFMVKVSPDSGDAKKCSIHSMQDRGLVIKRPATFTVQYNGAKGELHATIQTPTGAHEDCFIQELDCETYAVRFIPKENGVHYVQLLLNESHIPGSPFAIMVGSLATDPAMVHGIGEGLDKAKTGGKNRFVVRTANAGSSVLAVFIDGPSKTALSCKELDDGYEFIYTPFCPGKYLITIKYGNINIAGSPFQVESVGAGRRPSPIVEQSSMVVETVEKKDGGGPSHSFIGDPSKVVAKGTGLRKAFQNRPTNFTLDIKNAGNALLNVSMISPKGLPEPELTIKKTSASIYTVTYKVQEQGEHTLFVKWGDEDIPGSPFAIGS